MFNKINYYQSQEESFTERFKIVKEVEDTDSIISSPGMI